MLLIVALKRDAYIYGIAFEKNSDFCLPKMSLNTFLKSRCSKFYSLLGNEIHASFITYGPSCHTPLTTTEPRAQMTFLIQLNCLKDLTRCSQGYVHRFLLVKYSNWYAQWKIDSSIVCPYIMDIITSLKTVSLLWKWSCDNYTDYITMWSITEF